MMKRIFSYYAFAIGIGICTILSASVFFLHDFIYESNWMIDRANNLTSIDFNTASRKEIVEWLDINQPYIMKNVYPEIYSDLSKGHNYTQSLEIHGLRELNRFYFFNILHVNTDREVFFEVANNSANICKITNIPIEVKERTIDNIENNRLGFTYLNFEKPINFYDPTGYTLWDKVMNCGIKAGLITLGISACVYASSFINPEILISTVF